MSQTVTFIFDNPSDAAVFFLWWTNNGHEKLEDDLAALRLEHPGFSGSHEIEHATGQSITYAP